MTAVSAGRASRVMWPLLAGALVISWSSGFVGIRFASDHADVLVVLFWRTLVAGLILAPIAFLRGPRPSLKAIIEQIAFGAMTVYLYLGGFALAIGQRVPTGLVALISDLVPLAIAALSWPLLGEKLTKRQWLGTGLGAIGVIIASRNSLAIGSAPLWAYVLTAASMLVFAFSTVLQKRRGLVRMPLTQILAIQYLTGCVLFAMTVAPRESLLPPLNVGFAAGIAWLVLISTFAAYGVYYTCLRLYPAAQVGSVIFLSPPVTMVWGAMMFGEPLTPVMFLGLIVTMTGVLLTTRTA